MTSPSIPRVSIAPWRAMVFYAILALAVLVLMAQLFNLQVLQYTLNLAKANENRTREISVPPSRGIIYDRNGYILARNVASYNVVITPANLPNDQADIQEIYRELSALIGVPVSSGTLDDAKLVSPCVPGPGIAQWVELQETNAPYSSVKIQCNITEEKARIIREKAMDWPGVSVEIEPIRDYPTGSLTSDVIGFLGPIPAREEQIYCDQGFLPNRDKVGYSGVEAYYQNLLQGKPGKRVVEVDVAGQELANLQPPKAPASGDNLVMTIDTRLQKAAEAALIGSPLSEYGIDYWNSYFGKIRISSGVVIAINPKTGEILAMVSYPTYENNRLARIIPAYYYNQLAEDPRKPLLNHAVSDEYPPGSVFKLATAMGVLNEGVVTPDTVLETPGYLTLTESFSPNDPGFTRQFVDWIYDRNGVLNPAGFGHLDFYHCIAYSSDVCFYKLGGGFKTEVPTGLNIERIREYAQALGYNQPTGLDLLGESGGLVPTKQWKRINRGENWSSGDTYIATVGQGYVLSTPLQVLMSAATIANNGKQMQPTLVHEVTDNNGKVLTVWRDTIGNLYQPCSVNDKAGKPVSGWCDSDYSVTNNIVYSICQQPNTDNQLVSGWCGQDENQQPIFNVGAWQISPFQPHARWDMTVDKMIEDYQCDGVYCTDLNQKKTVQPWVLQAVQHGMRLAVTDPTGTLHRELYENLEARTGILMAGKTGTAEYCDNVAQAQNRCQFGLWPSHAWTLSYAPFDNPEIAVVAFAYNGGEGATVAAPIVRAVMEAYFQIKANDNGQATNGGG